MAARRFQLLLAASFLALGLFCLVYRGPGFAFTRGHLGDVASTGFLVAAAGLTGLSRPLRLACVAAIALGLELTQLNAPAQVSAARQLALGSRFDPLDLLFYALGLALAAAAESLYSRSRRSASAS
jgi:hypothetical protein